MLLVLTNICCDNCANKVKEYRTLDENNALEIDVCTSSPEYIKLVFPSYSLRGIVYYWNDENPSNLMSKQKIICINYTRKVINAN